MKRGVLLAVSLALAGCATTTPTVDLEPITAMPAEAPIEWFVETWGPFDTSPAEVGSGAHYGPMAFIDGEQLPRDSKGLETWSERHDFDRDDIRQIVVLHCRKGAWLFGHADQGPVFMIFTHDYEGPMPELRAREDHEC